MKKHGSLFTCLLFCSLLSFAQAPTKFTVRVSTDSILMGNSFQVVFSLENAQGNNFQAPDLSLYFDVLSGPNMSSSMQVINGQMSQSVSYTYYLQARETGIFYIEPASIETPDNYLETAPIEVLVVPNPDGIQQPMQPRRQPFGNFNFGRPGPNHLDQFPSMEDMMQQMEQFFQGNEDFFQGFGSPFQMGPDSLLFPMPFDGDILQMHPDSLWKQMPEEWKKLFPEGLDPKQKKKRKIYKM